MNYHHQNTCVLCRCILLVSLQACLLLQPSSAQLKKEILSDNVEHWYFSERTSEDSSFARRFANLFKVDFSPNTEPPFGRSVAFLVGVGKYQHLTPQLSSSVHNDIVQMREFLLGKANFDEVYVAVDDAVNRDLIERYVKSTLPSRMHHNDRLLFYYSGHGGDNHQGRTGYMLFGNVQPEQFYGNDVLAISALKDWSSELPIQHILFVLDSCSSGLGIVEKSGQADSNQLLLQTLSGNGSRTVITAGTASEKAYAEENRQQTGNSFFTRSLLDAFDSLSASDQKAGFITITELFAEIEKRMATLKLAHGKTTTPRMWKLDELDYKGTFVFLNPRVIAPKLTAEQANVLQGKVIPKTETMQENSGAGIIEVLSMMLGTLLIDDQNKGPIKPGETRLFLHQAAGVHRVKLMNTEPKEVVVDSGGVAYVSLGLKAPIDDSGSVPVGSLEVESTHELSGDVLIDDVKVGRLESNAKLNISHLVVGRHTFRLINPDEVESHEVEIKPDTTTYFVAPQPPLHLSATTR